MHRAHQRMFIGQSLQARLEVIAHEPGIVPEPFFLHDVQHCHADPATDRAATG
ncbi:hypothetical protein ALP03_03566 [Pseudomonas amygdali pv. tabaci]|uniref:Uncharacterized protein n=1 Tax=Pseudomonas amygdali pv. tabaci TaxID=322 RepID=A0A3M6FN05_PSEAJ|nr:hypothetical protein ALP03_03566 [Pseudomonas amygdali pv. tabaci]